MTNNIIQQNSETNKWVCHFFKLLQNSRLWLIFVYLITVTSCSKIYNEEGMGNLVPPTAEQDPSLPQIKINVAGHTRAIHLQTFGNPSNPPVFILHGGPGADFKLLLPLKQLADKFYVIMWDSRGAGLSERVGKDELSIESFDEEVAQVKAAISPGRKVNLIGHSFGGNIMAMYAAKHPADVNKLILITPGKLDLASEATSNGGAISFFDGQDFFWQNEILSSKDHASADYKAIEVLPKSSRHWTCDNSIITNYPFWRFGSYHYYIVQKNVSKLAGNYKWTTGIENFGGHITIITGTCGALSLDFQNINLRSLPGADLKIINGAGHISLFTDFADSTIATVRAALN